MDSIEVIYLFGKVEILTTKLRNSPWHITTLWEEYRNKTELNSSKVLKWGRRGFRKKKLTCLSGLGLISLATPGVSSAQGDLCCGLQDL